jgi:hypothetical protein
VGVCKEGEASSGVLSFGSVAAVGRAATADVG